jgi:hypothetical protein
MLPSDVDRRCDRRNERTHGRVESRSLWRIRARSRAAGEGELQWTELPHGVRRAKLDEVAKVLGRTVQVVEVAMLLGGRGAGLSARRYDLPARDRPDVEERWAVALLAKLEAEGAVEFRGKHLPRNELAHQLQFADREDDELGEGLLSALMGAAAVDEVYADRPELARLARATRPED